MHIENFQYLVVDENFDENFKIKLNERDFGRLIGLVVNDSLVSVTLSSGIVVEKSTHSDNCVEWKLYNPKTTEYVYTMHTDSEMDAFVNELMENRKALKGFDTGLQFQIQKGDRGSDSRLVFFFDYPTEIYNSFGLEEGKRFVKFLSSNIGNKFWQFAESATFVVDTSNMFNLKRLKKGNASTELIELEYCKGNERTVVRTVVHRWKNMTDEKAADESARLDGLLKKELSILENDGSEDDAVPEKMEAIKITEHHDSFDIVFCGNENFSLENVSYGIIPPFVSFLKSDHTTEDISITLTGKENSLVFSFWVRQLHQSISADQTDRKLMIEIPDEDDEGLSWITINQTELELLIKKLESISAGYRVGDMKVIRKGRNMTFTDTVTNRKTNLIIPVKDYPVVERYIIECLGRVLSKSDIRNSPTELSLYYSGYTENNQKTTFRLYNDGSLRITDGTIGIHIVKEHVPMFLVMLKSESGKFLATIGSKEKENAEGTES